MPTFSKVIRWSLVPLALLAIAALGLIGWAGAASRDAEPSEEPPGLRSAASAASVAAAGSASPRALPAVVPHGPGAQPVDQVVQARNAETRKEGERFVAAGWKLVEVPPPDARLVELDPALLAGREEELRSQIASTVASPSQAPRLAEIARRSSTPETQVAAVEALGRVGGDDAQRELTSLLTDLPEGSRGRREVAPLLHPANLSDARAAQLAKLLDAPSLDPAERKQIAFSLALVGLRDQSELPAAVLAALSPQSQELLASMTSLARLAPR